MTGENVEESFLKCSRVILNKIDNGEDFISAWLTCIPEKSSSHFFIGKGT